MEKNKFTFKDKIEYYRRRAGDTTLTPGQRQYAGGFIKGAEDSKKFYKDDRGRTLADQETSVEVAKKLLKYNKGMSDRTGYYQGFLATEQEILRKKKGR